MATEAQKITWAEVAAPATPAAGKVVTYAKADGLMYSKDDAGVETAMAAGAAGAPTNADYLVGTANGSLSAEIVVGTSPGGELGGTWASPTVDATHSGSTHLTGAWTSYTPTWTCSGTAPAIGNGTLRGAYLQSDKTLFLRFEFIAGTTTTFGTGDFRFAMPGALVAKNGVGQALVVAGIDVGNNYIGGEAQIGELHFADVYTYFIITNHAGGSSWGASVPFTWATTDRLSASGVIEID